MSCQQLASEGLGLGRIGDALSPVIFVARKIAPVAIKISGI
jgi:hypothetical protein